jgi:hypothetical protein
MKRLWLCLALLLTSARAAHADDTLVHVVRPGETLASIAELYYGEPRREGVIVAENGLGSEGGSSIVVGLRLVIPTVRYHRVSAGETWVQLAELYYGDARRAFILNESNAMSASKPPDVGAEILIPYPLRYFGSAHDPLRQAAKEYFDGSSKAIATIRRFNSLKQARVGRGEILLLPLEKLVLSEKGKKLAAAQTQPSAATGDVRVKQAHIHDQLPLLHENVLRGRYVEAVAMANLLTGIGDLTGNQIVSIQRELGTALIALDRDDLARDAFMQMLEKQPDVELGIGTTSPKVLRVLEEAKKALAIAKAAAAAAPKLPVADAGSAPASAVVPSTTPSPMNAKLDKSAKPGKSGKSGSK